MAKIIDVDFGKNVVCVAMEDNSVKELPFEVFKFKPENGKMINVYQKSDGSYIVEEAGSSSGFDKLNPNGGYKISKVTFLLVTFFLGGIGVHKFITGRMLQGILYLVLCWTGIPAILAIVEFVIGAMKNTDANGMIEVKGFFG